MESNYCMRIRCIIYIHVYTCMHWYLNEQLAHKRGVAGPKKMAPGSNYCQYGCLVKARNLLETDTNS